MSSFKSSY